MDSGTLGARQGCLPTGELNAVKGYCLARYTCRLPRSGLGPGVDVGLTEFGGAGCVTGVST